MAKKKIDKTVLLLIILGTLSFIGSCISYWFLNEQIPIQWDVSWKAARFARKEYVFLMGASPLLMLLLLEVLPKIDPKRKNYNKHVKSYRIMEVALVLTMIVMTWCTIAGGIYETLNMATIMPVIIGLLFLVVGNYLPTVRSNYFLGVRTPWALSNDQCWRKTNRFGGYVFILTGVLLLLGALFRSQIIYYLTMIFLIAGVGANFYYSYAVYKKLTRNDKE
ncbi:MAG: hypothetical protein E7256_12310 [Lachnospiraceae bacterium]|nr:hypothetical protein [Lachnospiraceae bacterium]